MKQHNDKISVWVVEDNELFQQNIVALINDQKNMICSGVYSSCEAAIQRLNNGIIPDVILHDIGFEGMNGISSVAKIKSSHSQIQIIMLTVYDDSDHIFDALRAGATGYLLKSSAETAIINGIQDVVSGGSPMNASIARKVIEVFSKSKNTSTEYSLSEREKDILQFLIRGYSNHMIAKELLLSVHTIDAHLRKIYEKLHVHSRTEAATKALKERIV